jgi:hypothetical protein
MVAFGHASGVSKQGSPGLSIFADVTVDGLVADFEVVVDAQYPADLFGAPTLLNHIGDVFPVQIRELGASASASASGYGVHVSDLGPVLIVVGLAVAGEFSADGAWRAPP